MTVRLRRAVPDDAPKLEALHARSWRASYAPYVPADALGAPLDSNMRARWSSWPADRLILLAEDSDSVLGFAAVVRADVPLLDNLHVDPDARSNGIGARLLKMVASCLAEEGASTLRLVVIADNARARRFYVRMGGQEGTAHDEALLGETVRMVPFDWSGDAFDALVADFDRQSRKDA
ncbi:N-acetyltransferase [Tateyamaria omphalii]|uniref:GNAT family N-acetyltransferase n=1 Tax=Tateyamaria omphalii TaxID=299262 RepID=UPI0016718A98|nr:GNAT family N-acetyltransferase [Tateyamaria omphalii]GGX46964.1 N-acetyltransferase [Tateyamaria omphalii]